MAVVDERDIGPLEKNCTGMLAAGDPLLAVTCTTSGCEKKLLTGALWLLPAMIVNPEMVTSGTALMLKLCFRLVLVATVAVMVTVPVAIPDKTVGPGDALPVKSVVTEELVRF